MLNWVELATVPPSTPTLPQLVSPTPMALPALPPLLTSPTAATPPLADALATPPLPADAISVSCMMVSPLIPYLCMDGYDPPAAHPQSGRPRSKPHATLALGPKAIKPQASPQRDQASHIPTDTAVCETAPMPHPCLPYRRPDGRRERRGSCHRIRPRRFRARYGLCL